MLSEWLGRSRYVAELTCLTNDSVIASLYVLADVLLGVSLLAAGLRVLHYRENGYWLYPFQVKLAGALAVLLAFGYFVDVLVIYEGVYRLEVVLRGAAAGVAVVFAFSFWTRVS